MPLVNLVVVLIIVGVGLYLINRYIPMASAIKSILNVVVVVAVCVGSYNPQECGKVSPISASADDGPMAIFGQLTFHGQVPATMGTL